MTELLPFDYWRINTRGLDNRECRRWSIRLRKFPLRIVSTVLNVQRAEPCIAQGLPPLEPLRNIEKDFYLTVCKAAHLATLHLLPALLRDWQVVAPRMSLSFSVFVEFLTRLYRTSVLFADEVLE